MLKTAFAFAAMLVWASAAASAPAAALGDSLRAAIQYVAAGYPEAAVGVAVRDPSTGTALDGTGTCARMGTADP